MEEIRNQLIRMAMAAREHAYAPYSHFQVGAALLAGSGKIYTGVNMENASYTPTLCAERNAFGSAIACGERRFTAIAIVGGPESGIVNYCPPCGVCRQVMREFCRPDSFKVILARSEDDFRELTLGQLLPESFGPEDLLVE